MWEKLKVPFLSSMVTVSLAHFIRNLYLRGVKGQPEMDGSESGGDGAQL